MLRDWLCSMRESEHSGMTHRVCPEQLEGRVLPFAELRKVEGGSRSGNKLGVSVLVISSLCMLEGCHRQWDI